MRRGFNRGVVEGSTFWLVMGALALLARLAGRALRRSPDVVLSERLRPGETLYITHESGS
jgi:hypothetical protein